MPLNAVSLTGLKKANEALNRIVIPADCRAEFQQHEALRKTGPFDLPL
jgi:hypothetical protein